jgi:hypothetical protein
VLDKNTSDPQSGVMLDYQVIGMIIYCIFIVIANLKIWFFSKVFSLLQMVILIGSVALYPITYYLYANLTKTDVYGYFKMSLSWNVLFVLFAAISICGVIDWAFEKYLDFSFGSLLLKFGKGHNLELTMV